MPLFTGLGVGGGYQFATVGATTGSPGTGTFTDANGQLWSYYRFTGSGSMTISSEGYIDLLVVGGGGGGALNKFKSPGGGGAVRWGIQWVTAGTYTVTVAGTTAVATNGSTSSFGSIVSSGGGGRAHSTGNTWDNNSAYPAYSGGGSGGGVTGPVYGEIPGAGQGISGLNYANASISYGNGGSVAAGAANTGNGGYGNNTGGSGIVIAKVRL